MTSKFRLIGLSRPKSATLNFIDSDRTTFWAKVAMSDERFNALWAYCKDNWGHPKIAIVEHDGVFNDGTPIAPVMVNVEEFEKG